MGKLLKKELILCMHPMVPIMLLLSCMVIIPNYPYLVMCFYSTLALFFTCLTGRENDDITYSMMLPISKKDVVKGRIGFAVMVQLIQVLLTIPFAFLSYIINKNGNEVGMDANVALFGLIFLLYGLFNFTFFTLYYKNTNKVGSSFLVSSVVVFVMISIEIVCSIAMPGYADKIDVPGGENLSYQCIVLASGLLFYIILTVCAWKKSEKSFERLEV